MGICIYCSQGAGWFRSKHKECAAAHALAVEGISTAVRDGLLGSKAAADLKDSLLAKAQTGRVGDLDLSKSIASGVRLALQAFLEDRSLSGDEESAIEAYFQDLPIKPEQVQEPGLADTITKASLLRGLAEGVVPEPRVTLDFSLPFLFQKSEKLIYAFNGIEYLEQSTRTEFQGRSQGFPLGLPRGFTTARVRLRELRCRFPSCSIRLRALWL